MIKKNILLLSLSLIYLFFGWHSSVAASEWQEAPANITIREFLDDTFSQSLSRQESDYMNSYNLVSFYPSDSPRNAFVLVIQTWHDSGVAKRDLRREIRKVGDALSSHFKALAGLPKVRKRWNIGSSKENFIIKHVRYTDLNEVLAVTVDALTYFDEATIKETSLSVKRRGGAWSF